AAAFAGFETVNEILGGLFAHAFQFGQLLGRQAIKIGDRLHQPGVHDLIDDLFAQAFDVHRSARCEAAQLALELADAFVAASAAVKGAVFIADHWRAATRAGFWEVENFLAPRARGRLGADDIRNDLPRFFDHDHVANADVLAGNEIGVM